MDDFAAIEKRLKEFRTLITKEEILARLESNKYYDHCCDILQAITGHKYYVSTDSDPMEFAGLVEIYHDTKSYEPCEKTIIPLEDFLRTDYEVLKVKYKEVRDAEKEAEDKRKTEAEVRRLEEYKKAQAIVKDKNDRATTIAYLKSHPELLEVLRDEA